VPIGFGQFQPTMNNKNNKLSGIRVVRIGYAWADWSGRVEHIFYDFLHLSHFHLLQIDKPTNKSLPSTFWPSPSNPQTNHCLHKPKPNPSLTPPSPSNPQTATNPNPSEKKRVRKREWKREQKREREREREREKIIQSFPTIDNK
jgi:hypothetical protein